MSIIYLHERKKRGKGERILSLKLQGLQLWKNSRDCPNGRVVDSKLVSNTDHALAWFLILPERTLISTPNLRLKILPTGDDLVKFRANHLVAPACGFVSVHLRTLQRGTALA